jgi:hypothetical protein
LRKWRVFDGLTFAPFLVILMHAMEVSIARTLSANSPEKRQGKFTMQVQMFLFSWMYHFPTSTGYTLAPELRAARVAILKKNITYFVNQVSDTDLKWWLRTRFPDVDVTSHTHKDISLEKLFLRKEDTAASRRDQAKSSHLTSTEPPSRASSPPVTTTAVASSKKPVKSIIQPRPSSVVVPTVDKAAPVQVQLAANEDVSDYSSSAESTNSQRAPVEPTTSLTAAMSDAEQVRSPSPKLEEPIQPPTTTPAITDAAQAAIRILESKGFSAVLFGSMASYQYGAMRLPNVSVSAIHPLVYPHRMIYKDVDILVLPPPGVDRPDPEFIKRQLVAADSSFYLRASINPLATFKVLYYRLNRIGKRFTKVDILLPGIMNLPALPLNRIVRIGDLPVIPFSLLLVTKLQCWDDHCNAEESFKRKKRFTDVSDLDKLLSLQHVERLKKHKPWESEDMFSPEQQQQTRRRVNDLCLQYPRFKEPWESLGLLTL